VRSRAKQKGRAEKGSFFALPHNILESDEYVMLSAIGVKLLIDLCSQYRGKNNGDLCLAWKIMERRGWRSRDTLLRAQYELEEKGWIERTRQGGRNKANLFALSWLGIDECKGKLDVRASVSPSNKWKCP